MRTYGRISTALTTADNAKFFIGNGVSNTGRLVDNLGRPIVAGLDISQLTQTDWQGRVALSDQARTNRIQHSDALEDAGNAGAAGKSVTVSSTQVGGSGPYYRVCDNTDGAFWGIVNRAVSYTPVVGDIIRALFWARAGTYTTLSCGIYGGNATAWDTTGTGVIVSGPGSIFPRAGSQNGAIFDVTGLSTSEDTCIEITRVVASGDNLEELALYPSSNGTPGVAGTLLLAACDLMINDALGAHIVTTSAPVTVTDYTDNGDGTVAFGQIPAVGAVEQWSGDGYVASGEYSALNPKFWAEVDTAPDGNNDAVYLTTLAQVLKLNFGESPFFANYGIPQYQTVVTQVFPDYYASITQTQFAPYFAALAIQRQQGTTPPVYDVSVTLHTGTQISTTVPT